MMVDHLSKSHHPSFVPKQPQQKKLPMIIKKILGSNYHTKIKDHNLYQVSTIKHINQECKQYLQTSGNFQQSNWVKLIPPQIGTPSQATQCHRKITLSCMERSPTRNHPLSIHHQYPYNERTSTYCGTQPKIIPENKQLIRTIIRSRITVYPENPNKGSTRTSSRKEQMTYHDNQISSQGSQLTPRRS